MLHAKYQPYIPYRSGENVDFIGLAMFSIGDYLGFSSILNFIILKHKVWSCCMGNLRTIDAVVSENKPLNGLESQGRRKLC